ncbi:DUF2971 domain-containing protein [Pseudomonas sp. JV241A]|uniref:DUF2971 domain-containing protein n=1 Tax=Pseudomonas sp. JV241A TaxID=2078785 RepID=UPI00100D158A|nr:DUF2971 domain-containing protein [Pseudomonas sp. JV241A]SPO67883.1 conserved protein of unknown function [Pseudomonas sp. JV241A]
MDDAQILFHYTSQAGLLGVLRSNGVWASHTGFLNDASECSHAFDLAKSMVGTILDTDDYLDVFSWELRRFLQLMRAPEIYVTSFSEKPDLLSQWRGYCPGGSGVCIGVDKNLLNGFCEENGFRFERCIYEREELEKKLHELIDECWKKFPAPPLGRAEYEALPVVKAVQFSEEYRELVNFGGGKLEADAALKWFGNELTQLAPLYKNEGFHEEAEWRVVVHKPEKIEFRVGTSCLIPYSELKIFDSKDMFRQLIIGPSPNQQRSSKAAKMALESFGFDKVFVWSSGIPFNNW